jgi:NADH dehydrogenase
MISDTTSTQRDVRPEYQHTTLTGNQQNAAGTVSHPRVVIVGGGFGGLSAARTLAHSEADVLVLDRNNYHGFWPLLYQVAMAGLEPESVTYPLRAIFRNYPNVTFHMTTVQSVDFERKLVHASHGTEPYDHLILAAGSTSYYFGSETLAQHTYPLKDIDEAERLRNHILTCFEQAVYERDTARRQTLLTFVLVGGGPTGVEMAGALSELLRHVIHKDFPELDIAETHMVLVEGLDRLLSAFAEPLGQDAQNRLEAMGVQVRLNTLATDASANQITFKDGSVQATNTIIWTAGVRGSSLADALDVPQAKGGRVRITSTLHLPDHPEVFVVGDMSYLAGYQDEHQSHPMLAPVAMQQGEQAAKNLLAQVRQQPMRHFIYNDRGKMATIGRRAAVVDAFGIHLTGLLAWLGWLLVHLMELVGFRNRIIVLINWAYNYFTYDKGFRVIDRRECP